jgi:2-C-methyl-D-erythritol 2,4-cyclodiphosphate synthase
MDTPPKQRHRLMVQGLSPVRKAPAAETLTAPMSSVPTAPFRVGHGYDIHKLQPGGQLLLGGVVVSDQLSAIAHSDGDVVIHALVDAILGAMGWGDIGELFPDSDAQWKGAASRVFLQRVCDRIRGARQRVLNADITILAERPRISPYKSQIVQTLREMLGPESTVNIKAGTNEGLDAVGRGEAIAAHAVVLIAAET